MKGRCIHAVKSYDFESSIGPVTVIRTLKHGVEEDFTVTINDEELDADDARFEKIITEFDEANRAGEIEH